MGLPKPELAKSSLHFEYRPDADPYPTLPVLPSESRLMLNETSSIADFQKLIDTMYSRKDAERGVDGTFMWLMEEIGELAAELRGNDKAATAKEFADVLAWLVTIANVAGIDVQQAVIEKYGTGCPGCSAMVCVCNQSEKP